MFYEENRRDAAWFELSLDILAGLRAVILRPVSLLPIVIRAF